ncbi:MAG TPA: 1-(5-phosphoribosyl)-5-[(5-phosphoribosylamino)methylideneamino]imidazole-4-carboxamide isomerase [bacterium]|nr:1-(5-phosphoribosyl)-5-[(5-phosphoribosylamino)methylideneamino]imidazole-4-carboxamide isomerase [bacterium]
MIIIPSIDLRAGKCVRLIEGKLENEIVYSGDPVFVAQMYKAEGAKRIHIVDLDGAFAGYPKNLDMIEKIRAKVELILDMGGGLRSVETMEMVLKKGVDRIVLGTVAIHRPELLDQALAKFGKEKVTVAVDERDGFVHVAGWKEETLLKTEDFIGTLEKKGVGEIIFTEISRDGALQGVALERIKQVMKFTSMQIIISGGVTSMKDLEDIAKLNPFGAVIGRAYYTGNISLKEAIKTYAG